jgi:kynurenine formamidase
VVEEAIYLGTMVKYLVRINPGEVLVVRAPKAPGAALLAWAHQRGYKLPGQDAIGFENGRIDPKRPVHNYLLKRDVILLEGLCNLREVVGRPFTLFAVPIKLRRGTAAQCRAFALLE